ncbi:MAG: hypothetical protein ACYTKD_12955 [Planctomycetota bacterium]
MVPGEGETPEKRGNGARQAYYDWIKPDALDMELKQNEWSYPEMVEVRHGCVTGSTEDFRVIVYHGRDPGLVGRVVDALIDTGAFPGTKPLPRRRRPE